MQTFAAPLTSSNSGNSQSGNPLRTAVKLEFELTTMASSNSDFSMKIEETIDRRDQNLIEQINTMKLDYEQ